jgi:hypothetical protein
MHADVVSRRDPRETKLNTFVSEFRIFTIVAIIASGLLELLALVNPTLSNPLIQIAFAAALGVAVAAFARLRKLI